MISFLVVTARPAKGEWIQGTWQFISIARLRDPSSRPHEVSDDLESFFWVLLYLVVKCRNARPINLVVQMQEVFDHHTNIDRTGVVTGGVEKLACVRNAKFDRTIVRALVQTPCKGIIEDFRALFCDFYLHLPSVPDDSLGLFYEADREDDPQVKSACKKLSSSQWVLDMINGHLAHQWNVDDDGSLHTTILHPDSVASGDLLKRKARDSQDDVEENFNRRRKGRLPPANSKSSRDNIWSQRGPHIRIGTCTTAESSPRGGPSASSSSVPSRGSKLGI